MLGQCSKAKLMDADNRCVCVHETDNVCISVCMPYVDRLSVCAFELLKAKYAPDLSHLHDLSMCIATVT